MKTIKIKKLKLLNFCGIREGCYEFTDGVNIISGRNASGKSTIANAISYALFGTNQRGDKIEIKTYDDQMNIIPEIPHEVTLILSVDDKEVSIKRTVNDKWNGNEVSNTYKYFIDDEVVTYGDFTKYVNGICDEFTFHAASSTTWFLQKPWTEQRKMLQTLAEEDVTADKITQGKEKYDFVLDAIKKESIDKYIAHINYQIKEVQKELDKIPVRLSELSKAMPKEENWAELVNLELEYSTRLEELEKKKSELVNGGANNIVKDGIRRQIEFENKRKDNMEKSARNLSTEEQTKHESDRLSANSAYKKAESTLKDLKDKMDGYTDTEVHLNEQISQYKEELNEAGKLYEEVNAETWEWDDKSSFCPHCGQALPLADLTRMKSESISKFNENKADRMKKLLKKAEDIKKEYRDCKELMSKLEEDRKLTISQLSKANEVFNEAETALEKVEKEKARTFEDILSSKEEYKQVCENIKSLEGKLEEPESLDEDKERELASIRAEKNKISDFLRTTKEKLATKETYDKVNKLIDDVNNDKRTYQEQLDSLTDKKDIASDYFFKSCQLLEDSVNKHFSFVKWSLFLTLNKGDKKPSCECYHNGVPFRYLNNASQINSGIDIANTISKYYNISLPIIIDNCESVQSPIYDGGQQIRLCVSDNDKLMVTSL